MTVIAYRRRRKARHGCVGANVRAACFSYGHAGKRAAGVLGRSGGAPTRASRDRCAAPDHGVGLDTGHMTPVHWIQTKNAPPHHK